MTRDIRRVASARSRSLLNPVLTRAGRSSDYDVANTLVIAGFPRSGTTWLAEIVNAVPGTGILFEPLNFQMVEGAKLAGCDWENFRLADEEWPEGEKFIGNVLAGRVTSAWTTSHLSPSRAWRVSRWIVKFVRANMLLPWLVRRFDIPPPVFLIRHPCAVYDSYLRRGWHVPESFPGQGSRFWDMYPEFKAVAEGLQHTEEFFAALWCMRHYPPLVNLDPRSYQLCFYEHLVSDGINEVRKIMNCWQLPELDGIEELIVRPSAKASDVLRAGTKHQLQGWQRRLDPLVVERVAAVLENFGLNFYGVDPEPNPHLLPPSGSDRSGNE